MPQPAFLQSIDPNPDGTTTFQPQAACEIVFHEARPSSRRDLERHLADHGCAPIREGARHTIWSDSGR